MTSHVTCPVADEAGRREVERRWQACIGWGQCGGASFSGCSDRPEALGSSCLNHECRDVLNPFKIAPELFQKKPLNGGTFTLDVTLSDYLTCPNKEKE